MQAAFLSVLITIALCDLFFSKEVRVAPVLLLFIVAKSHADYAAAKLMKLGLPLKWIPNAPWVRPAQADDFAETSSPELPPFKEVHELKVISLSEARAKRKNAERVELRKREKLAKERAAKEQAAKAAREAQAAPPPKPERPPFELPKFRGKPHEVLGVKENPSTRQIQQAFRHWIKAYHPDHQPDEHTKATERARQLNVAKDTLLTKRKQMRKAA